MSVLLPPPKRQKVYHGIPEPVAEPQAPCPNIVVQFVSEEDGTALAPAVNIPANVSKEGLEALVNKLKPEVRLRIYDKHRTEFLQDDGPVPFSFHISLPADAIAAGAPTRLVISKSIESDVLNHPSDAFTPEDVFIIHCSPQAVFKVRPATRCSSTLPGENHSIQSNKSNRCARPYLSHPLRIILSNWKFTGHGLR